MSTEDLVLEWNRQGNDEMKKAVSISDHVIMSQFILEDYELDEIKANYVTGEAAYLTVESHKDRVLKPLATEMHDCMIAYLEIILISSPLY